MRPGGDVLVKRRGKPPGAAAPRRTMEVGASIWKGHSQHGTSPFHGVCYPSHMGTCLGSPPQLAGLSGTASTDYKPEHCCGAEHPEHVFLNSGGKTRLEKGLSAPTPEAESRNRALFHKETPEGTWWVTGSPAGLQHRGCNFPSGSTRTLPPCFLQRIFIRTEGDALPQLVHRTCPQPRHRAAAQMCI